MNNKHQKLIAGKVAEFETAVEGIHGSFFLVDIFESHLKETIDKVLEEERERTIKIITFTKFRDTQPKEPYHKYLQQSKGVDYIRSKKLKALDKTP